MQNALKISKESTVPSEALGWMPKQEILIDWYSKTRKKKHIGTVKKFSIKIWIFWLCILIYFLLCLLSIWPCACLIEYVVDCPFKICSLVWMHLHEAVSYGKTGIFHMQHYRKQVKWSNGCHTVNIWFIYTSGPQTFVSCGPLQKTLIMTLGLCNITAKLPSEGLCLWHPENHSVAPKKGRGPHLRHSDLYFFWKWLTHTFSWGLHCPDTHCKRY